MESSTKKTLSAADAPNNWPAARAAFCRYSSPRFLAMLILFCVAGRLFFGPLSLGDLAAIIVPVVGWPFIEWSMHRWLLHLAPVRLPWRKEPAELEFARIHRLHHAQPWRADLTVLPLIVPVALAPALLGLGLWLLPVKGLAFTALASAASMALLYEWTHFIVHTRIQPKSRYAKAVFLNHRMHHFRHEGLWFSFTVPMLDRWLGTGPDYKSTDKR